MDLQTLSEQELKTMLEKSLSKAEVYNDCRDGSYEMALESFGVYAIRKELKSRGEE